MQRTSIRNAVVAALSLAALASAAPAAARLPVPIEGRAFPEPAPVVEYHHAEKNLYFITADSQEMTSIDAKPASGWGRMSNQAAFYAVTEPVTLVDSGGRRVPSKPVCRFFIPPASHFFSASAAECAALRDSHPELVLETNAAFFAWAPDMDGNCPSVLTEQGFANLTPVYRLWNARGDRNHRYTTSIADRKAMIETGWIAEGYGDAGVAMCVPQ